MADDDGFSDLLMAIRDFDEHDSQNEKKKDKKLETNQVCVDSGKHATQISTLAKSEENTENTINSVKTTSAAKEQSVESQSSSGNLHDQFKEHEVQSEITDMEESSVNPSAPLLNSPGKMSTNNSQIIANQLQIKTEPSYDGYERSASNPEQQELNPSLCVISCVSSLSSTEQDSFDLTFSSSQSISEPIKPVSSQADQTSSLIQTPLSVSVKLEPLESQLFTNEVEINSAPVASESASSAPSPSKTWEQNLTAVIDAVASGKDSMAQKSSGTSRTRANDHKNSLLGPKSTRSSKQAGALKSDCFRSLVPMLTRLSDSTLALYTNVSLSSWKSKSTNVLKGKNANVMKVDGIDIEIDCPGPSLPVGDMPSTSSDSKSSVKKGKAVAKKRSSAKSKNVSKKSDQCDVSVSDKAKEAVKSIKEEVETNIGNVKLEPSESAQEVQCEILKKASKGSKERRGGKSANLQVCKKEVNSPKTRSFLEKVMLEEDHSESKMKKEKSTDDPGGAGPKIRRNSGEDRDRAKKVKGKVSDNFEKESNKNMETNYEEERDESVEQAKGKAKTTESKMNCDDSFHDKDLQSKAGQKTLMEMNVENYLTEGNQMCGKKTNKLNFTVPKLKESAKKGNHSQDKDSDVEKLANKGKKKRTSLIKSEPLDESVLNKGRSESRSSSCDTIGSVVDDPGESQNLPSYLELDKSTKLWKIKEKLRQVGALMELCIQGFDKQDIGQIVQVVALFTADFEVYARWSPNENFTIFISCLALEVVKNLLLQIYALCLTKRSLTIGFKHVGMYPAVQITFRVNMPNGISVFDDTVEKSDLSSHEAAFSGNLMRVPAVCYPYVLLGSQHCKLQKIKTDSGETEKRELRFFFSSQDTLDSFLSFYESVRINGKQTELVYKGVKRKDSHVDEVDQSKCYPNPTGLVFSEAKEVLLPESELQIQYNGILFPQTIYKLSNSTPKEKHQTTEEDSYVGTCCHTITEANKSETSNQSNNVTNKNESSMHNIGTANNREDESNKSVLPVMTERKRKDDSLSTSQEKDLNHPESQLGQNLPVKNQSVLPSMSQGQSVVNQGPTTSMMSHGQPPIVSQGPPLMNQCPPPPVMSQGPSPAMMGQGPPPMSQGPLPAMIGQSLLSMSQGPPPPMINQFLSMMNQGQQLPIMNQGPPLPMMPRGPPPIRNLGPPVMGQGSPFSMINQGPPPHIINQGPPAPMMVQGRPLPGSHPWLNQVPPPPWIGPVPFVSNQVPPVNNMPFPESTPVSQPPDSSSKDIEQEAWEASVKSFTDSLLSVKGDKNSVEDDSKGFGSLSVRGSVRSRSGDNLQSSVRSASPMSLVSSPDREDCYRDWSTQQSHISTSPLNRISKPRLPRDSEKDRFGPPRRSPVSRDRQSSLHRQGWSQSRSRSRSPYKYPLHVKRYGPRQESRSSPRRSPTRREFTRNRRSRSPIRRKSRSPSRGGSRSPARRKSRSPPRKKLSRSTENKTESYPSKIKGRLGQALQMEKIVITVDNIENSNKTKTKNEKMDSRAVCASPIVKKLVKKAGKSIAKDENRVKSTSSFEEESDKNHLRKVGSLSRENEENVQHVSTLSSGKEGKTLMDKPSTEVKSVESSKCESMTGIERNKNVKHAETIKASVTKSVLNETKAYVAQSPFDSVLLNSVFGNVLESDTNPVLPSNNEILESESNKAYRNTCEVSGKCAKPDDKEKKEIKNGNKGKWKPLQELESVKDKPNIDEKKIKLAAKDDCSADGFTRGLKLKETKIDKGQGNEHCASKLDKGLPQDDKEDSTVAKNNKNSVSILKDSDQNVSRSRNTVNQSSHSTGSGKSSLSDPSKMVMLSNYPSSSEREHQSLESKLSQSPDVQSPRDLLLDDLKRSRQSIESKLSQSPDGRSPRDHLLGDLKRSRGSNLLRKKSSIGRSVSPTFSLYDRFRNRSRSPDAPQLPAQMPEPYGDSNVDNLRRKEISMSTYPIMVKSDRKQSLSPDGGGKLSQHHVSRKQTTPQSPSRLLSGDATQSGLYLHDRYHERHNDGSNSRGMDDSHDRLDADRCDRDRDRLRWGNKGSVEADKYTRGRERWGDKDRLEGIGTYEAENFTKDRERERWGDRGRSERTGSFEADKYTRDRERWGDKDRLEGIGTYEGENYTKNRDRERRGDKGNLERTGSLETDKQTVDRVRIEEKGKWVGTNMSVLDRCTWDSDHQRRERMHKPEGISSSQADRYNRDRGSERREDKRKPGGISSTTRSPQHPSFKRAKFEEVRTDSDRPFRIGSHSPVSYHADDNKCATISSFSHVSNKARDLDEKEEWPTSKTSQVTSSFQQKIMDALARKLGIGETLLSGTSSSERNFHGGQPPPPALSRNLESPSSQTTDRGASSQGSPMEKILCMLSQKAKPVTEEQGNTHKQQMHDTDLQQVRIGKLTVTPSNIAQGKPKAAKKPAVPSSNDDIIEMIRRLQKEVKPP
ncbi:hypothetical protein RRG08_025652 [Elysia crispata]|uniref:Uncharacterized protein n=1 Tax=Elysia crispata TaxID=231223 RepID=A0AAE0YE34_9GAST|nr:hypothetical protein RRG08_025652 [Elysia crispata]